MLKLVVFLLSVTARLKYRANVLAQHKLAQTRSSSLTWPHVITNAAPDSAIRNDCPSNSRISLDLEYVQAGAGVSEIFGGPCHESARTNTWLHLGINAVSTMFLSGSNYCMQILSARTRKEIDTAHTGRKWLDIGVPSVRNLKNVAMMKVVMWWLLGLSSVPLHLMYSSVSFSTIATKEYDVIFVSEAFVKGGPNSSWNESKFPGINYVQAQAKTWERLDGLACLNAYAVEFLNTG